MLRGATVNTSMVLKTFTYDSNWWTRPPLGFVDTTAPPGTTQTYRIPVHIGLRERLRRSAATVSIPAGTAPTSATGNGPRQRRLRPLAPRREHGTTANDWANADDLTLSTAAARGVSGRAPQRGGHRHGPGTTSTTTVQGAPQSWLIGGGPPGAVVRSPGVLDGGVVPYELDPGGKIVGFGDSRTGRSGTNGVDRHLYMTSNGQLRFGLRPERAARLTINSHRGSTTTSGTTWWER